MSSPAISVRDARRAYGAKVAVNGVSLDLNAGRITCLLGPSGCGKSTLLRLIAGLEPLDAGTVHAGERLLSDAAREVPPEDRGVGLVFQDYALFPHLTAVQNVAFGLTAVPRKARRPRALALLEHVHLAARADAFPHMLSGGEQQRVALARALARQPAAVLLDEPFSGLDSHLKAEVRETLLSALRAAGAAVLIVTHDAEEALLMADDLALMDQGRILQTGSARDAYLNPVSPAAARLLGEAQLIPARIVNGVATTAFGDLAAPGLPDGAAEVMVRPEGLVLSPDGVEATVSAVRFGGGFFEVTLIAGVQTARLRLAGDAPVAGERVRARIDPERARVFPG